MAAEKSQKSDLRESTGKPASGEVHSGQDVFDVRKVRRLVELMKEFDLSQMDLRQGGQRIQLRRGFEPTFIESAPRPVPAPAPTAAPAPEKAAAPSPVAAPVDEGKTILIRSPMVGTFYMASDPDTPPYVKVGDHVGPETTVCIVEAMKVFNEIPAEVSGKITAVLVENGAPVEFGQPLYKVDPRG
jgi:acetyl-CoA carboxylase biotin carboxyl carrier protein